MLSLLYGKVELKRFGHVLILLRKRLKVGCVIKLPIAVTLDCFHR